MTELKRYELEQLRQLGQKPDRLRWDKNPSGPFMMAADVLPELDRLRALNVALAAEVEELSGAADLARLQAQTGAPADTCLRVLAVCDGDVSLAAQHITWNVGKWPGDFTTDEDYDRGCARQVRALRDATGCGKITADMALRHCGGDHDKAVEWLRSR